ncbi:MAG: hypothetical protein J0L77_05195 [Alphaproteobacteria bacterium]|nr:hypothetical protein [Alphaproteobacteria bacterium]
MKSASDPGLIVAGTSEVSTARLMFYDGVSLFKVTNFASLPSFTFEYLGDGTFFQYLDGTETPIYAVNDKGALRLTVGSVIDYLAFFFSHVTGEGGDETLLVKNPHDMPMLDSLDPGAYDAVIRGHQPAQVKDQDDGGFVVDADIYDSGQLSRAQIAVSPSGRVVILARKMILQSVARGLESEHYLA